MHRINIFKLCEKVTYLTEFELNQPSVSSRSSSIINVSNSKTKTMEENSDAAFKSKTLIEPSSPSSLTPINHAKKVSGHYEQMKHGKEKQQLLHQVYIIHIVSTCIISL